MNLTKILGGSLRHYYLPEPQFKQMDQFISGVRSPDVKPASLFARDDGDFELVLKDGARIIFNSKQEYSRLLENLETVLEGAGLSSSADNSIDYITRVDRLPTPQMIEGLFPIPSYMIEHVMEGRDTVRAILAGEDSRFLVIVGPCSIHDPQGAIEYAKKLAVLKKELNDRLFIVMRVYFEKPRTTIGWKGLINNPRMDGTCDIEEGLRVARRLLLEINDLG